MTTFVALLRGINVGGRNRIPMAGLKSALSSLGLEEVVTFIQSGNVIFGSPSGDEEELVLALEQRIAEVFGIDIAVLLRTRSELAAIASANPFPVDVAEPPRVHVAFLDRVPEREAVARLEPHRSPPDEFSLRGREIYLHYPNGSGRSKLTIDYFERRLGTRATMRNWNTVTTLLALAEP